MWFLIGYFSIAFIVLGVLIVLVPEPEHTMNNFYGAMLWPITGLVLLGCLVGWLLNKKLKSK